MSNKINVLEKIVKSVKICKERSNKGVVSYKLKIELEGGFETKIPMLSEDIQMIKVLETIGYSEPIKSIGFVQELSKETGELYYCVRIDLADDSVIRKFLPNNESGFKFKAIVDKLVAYYTAQEEKKDKAVKETK